MLALLTTLLLAAAPPDTMLVPLGEVVVTGTRLPETALRVPAAVSVVKRDEFAGGRTISLKDALAPVPGVFAQSRAGAQDMRITVRGFGARGNGDRSNVGNLRGIRVMTDGIPVSEPDGRTSLDFADLGSADRVEVSRSNASTLYGNASGGVIHLRTDLDFDRPWVEWRQRLGEFGFHREQLVTGFLLGEARGRLSLLNGTFDGWREHSRGSIALAQLRMAVPLASRSRLGVLLDAVSNLNRFPGALTRAEAASDPTQADPAYVERDERRWNRIARIGLTLDQALPARQDLLFTAFVEPKAIQRSERSRYRDFTRYHVGGSAQWRMRHEFAPGIEGVFSAGADEAYQDGAILFYNVVDGDRGTQLRANKREAANSAGAYGQAELHLHERWRLTAAARWDAVNYVSEDFIDPALDATKRFDHLTPKVAVSYQTGRHTLYGAVGGGLETPAFNEIDPPPPYDTLVSLNPFLDPMLSVTAEAGAKGDWGAPGDLGELEYDVALYWIDVRNDLVPFDGGAYFETAGRARRRGLEAGLRWLARPWLTLTGAFSLSNDRYVEYITSVPGTGDADYAGNQVAGLPAARFEGGAEFAMANGLSARLGVTSVDGYWADDANTLRVDPFTTLSARIGYQRQLGRYGLRLFAGLDNLADAGYVESVYINPTPQPDPADVRFLEPGLPRNWSAGIDLRFD